MNANIYKQDRVTKTYKVGKQVIETEPWIALQKNLAFAQNGSKLRYVEIKPEEKNGEE